MNKGLVCILFSGIILTSCQSQKTTRVSGENIQEDLQEKLINAQPGEVVELPEGTFTLTGTVSLDDISNVTIKGAGMKKTILSFADQATGAEGLKITKADGILLEGFTIQDTKGDAIKIQNTDGVTIRDVNTTWTGGAKETNGAYGIYPVSCKNVLIEKCEASYASDAGIYVGQSINVIVRGSFAHHNVAGIEIENCIDSEVYDNLAENNTGGILVFDMPDLPLADGRNCRVYNNVVRNNNHKNFAPEGNIVGEVPPGTGMLVLAFDNVELFNNQIINNKTCGIIIASYYMTQRPFNDTTFGPYSSAVSIYNNTIERKFAIPDLTTNLGKLMNLVFKGQSQDIVIDGMYDPKILDANGNVPEDRRICVRNNGAEIRFANLNAHKASDPKDIFKTMDRDMSKVDCTLPALQEVVLAAPGK